MTSDGEVMTKAPLLMCLWDAVALVEDFVRTYFAYAILVFFVLIASYTVDFPFFPSVYDKLVAD